MKEKPENDRPVCRFCGRPLSKEDAEISGGTCCFDCAITYMAGAAHQMAEGIRAKKKAEQEAQTREEELDPEPPQGAEGR